MDEEEYLPLSGLSQADYCLRRAAILLNERFWEESSDTAKGRAEHERVHTQRVERRKDEIKLYENTVFSDKLHLIGKCDCIEAVRDESGCMFPAADFPVKLYPVEFKHGKLRSEREYEIQLCAQAICLEEMYNTNIKKGALFYITSHRRLEIEFTDELRQIVCETARKLRHIRNEFLIPEAVYEPKCLKCSIKEYCMPRAKRSARSYCAALEQEAKGDIL